jgi:hypothetical protein
VETALVWGVPIGLIGLIGLAGWVPVGTQVVATFEQDFGLRASPDTRRFVRHYLTMGKRLRYLTFLAVVSIPPSATIALGGEVQGVRFISTPVVVGLMAATLVAELTLGRPASRGGRRTASLRRRDLGAYLSRTLLWGPTAIGVAAAGAWLAAIRFLDPSPSSPWPEPTLRDVATGTAVAITIPVLVTLTCRWVVRRPQPLVDPDLVAADDAIRSSSVRRLAAMGCIVGLFNLAGALQRYADAAEGFGDTALAVAVAVCILLAWGAWLVRGRGPTWWRRPARHSDAATPPAAPTGQRA